MTKKHRVLFVGKGGSRAGLGHLVRLGTLMRAFQPQCDVSMLANLDETGRFLFGRLGIRFSLYADVRDLRAFLKRNGVYDIIVLDMYPLPKYIIAALDDHCDVLLGFDDMETCLDTKIGGAWICPQETFPCQIYSDGGATIVKGSDYFPLRPDLLLSRSKKRWTPDVRSVAVVLGGAPQESPTLALTKFLDSFMDSQVKLYVVGGFGRVREESLGFSPRLTFMQNIDLMGDFIRQMDLGIIGGGFVKYDFMCVGTPFAMISLCTHQDKLGRKFSSPGYGEYWGPLTDCLNNPRTFKKKVLELCSNKNRRHEISVRSKRLVDGRGAQRILQLAEDLKKGKKVA